MSVVYGLEMMQTYLRQCWTLVVLLIPLHDIARPIDGHGVDDVHLICGDEFVSNQSQQCLRD